MLRSAPILTVRKVVRGSEGCSCLYRLSLPCSWIRQQWEWAMGKCLWDIGKSGSWSNTCEASQPPEKKKSISVINLKAAAEHLCCVRVRSCSYFSAKQILTQNWKGGFLRIKPKDLERCSWRFILWHSCYLGSTDPVSQCRMGAVGLDFPLQWGAAVSITLWCALIPQQWRKIIELEPCSRNQLN